MIDLQWHEVDGRRELRAFGGRFVIWRDRFAHRWRWAYKWGDQGDGFRTHGGGRSLLAACRSVRRNARTRGIVTPRIVG